MVLTYIYPIRAYLHFLLFEYSNPCEPASGNKAATRPTLLPSPERGNYTFTNQTFCHIA